MNGLLKLTLLILIAMMGCDRASHQQSKKDPQDKQEIPEQRPIILSNNSKKNDSSQKFDEILVSPGKQNQSPFPSPIKELLESDDENTFIYRWEKDGTHLEHQRATDLPDINGQLIKPHSFFRSPLG